ncbi:MAG: toxin-antitoxin system HicB family antitoxin [Desulfobacteraceae bacterium]|nr:toxin-antitoxin system HicB family antitoxin [Desulfobacteraceae bacterium]
MSPGIHTEIATAAANAGKSLNKWIADTLDQIVHSLNCRFELVPTEDRGNQIT